MGVVGMDGTWFKPVRQKAVPQGLVPYHRGEARG